MKLIAAPVSGGSFPKQLSIMKFLVKHFDYVPDIALGSSGGAVALYLLLAAEWKDYNIERIINCLDSDMMVENVAPSIMNLLPNKFIGMMMGCIYKMSNQVNEMFLQNFTYERICKTEVWVAAVENETGYVDLFCNRSLADANIKEPGRLPIYKANCNYMDGDIDIIADCVKASSSIPMIFQSVEIDGRKYIDSGAKAGSPLAPLSVILEESYKEIHIIYVNGYDLESNPPIRQGSNMFTTLSNTGNKVVRAMVEQDRNRGISIVCRGRKAKYKEFAINRLSEIYDKLDETESSFLEIYVENENVINYADFDSGDIIEFMKFCEDNIMCRLWWIGEDIFDGVHVEELDKDVSERNDRKWEDQDMTLYVDPNYRL